jgi:hypothetical protein
MLEELQASVGEHRAKLGGQDVCYCTDVPLVVTVVQEATSCAGGCLLHDRKNVQKTCINVISITYFLKLSKYIASRNVWKQHQYILVSIIQKHHLLHIS